MFNYYIWLKKNSNEPDFYNLNKNLNSNETINITLTPRNYGKSIVLEGYILKELISDFERLMKVSCSHERRLFFDGKKWVIQLFPLINELNNITNQKNLIEYNSIYSYLIDFSEFLKPNKEFKNETNIFNFVKKLEQEKSIILDKLLTLEKLFIKFKDKFNTLDFNKELELVRNDIYILERGYL